jgi:SAM-dependent methyltransferase
VNDDSFKASDAEYHSRHARRTASRARCIASHLSVSGNVLDVGCNKGITSAYLLQSANVNAVTGVELYRATVRPSLLQDARFELLEGNIVELELPRCFDYVVYGAVHHHVLHHNGLSVAVETLRRLIHHCDRSLFFETGHVTEGGRWGWQRSMRRYFRTDEEHLHYLLRSIEEDIDGFEIIGRFPIHGIRRAYLRIDVRKDKPCPRPRTPGFQPAGEFDGPFGRHFGSAGPSLMMLAPGAPDDSPNHFWITGKNTPDAKFIKLYRHHPISARTELEIGRQITAEWAVRPEATPGSPHVLVSPYLANSAPISDFRTAPAKRRQKLAKAVIAIFAEAASIRVTMSQGLLLGSRQSARLIDVIDMNPNNLLVEVESGIERVRVIDFEKHGDNNGSRNRMHLGKVLWKLRTHRLRAIACLASGLSGTGWQLVKAAAQPLRQRIRARQPSVFSLAVADIRSVLGRIAGRILAAAGLN